MEYEKFSFSFFLRKKENPFVYEIGEEERQRFNKICDLEIMDRVDNSFFCFETQNGLQVAVSLKNLQFAYNLFDPDYDKILEKTFSENNGGGSISLSLLNKRMSFDSTYPFHENVHIYIKDRKEILKCGVDNASEAFNIMHFLESYPEHGERFLSFLDIDGEDVIINPEEILVLEIPSKLYNEGYKEIFPESET